jgi:short-subunit dehydrogenase
MALPDPFQDGAVLVTGASSGIGADIARSLARRDHNVILVARREDRLAELAGELSDAHGVRAETIGCDLQKDAPRNRMLAQVEGLGLEVYGLVNNAGIGSGGLFHQLDARREAEMVRLNCEVVVALSGHLVPEMVANGRGAVLNVASTAAFQPLPTMATYSASKAFVLAFSQATGADLHGTGVSVTALCPGPVKTEFIEAASLEREAGGLPEFVWVSSPDVAEAGVEGMEDGKGVVIPGALNRLSSITGQHVPRGLFTHVARRVYRLGDS